MLISIVSRPFMNNINSIINYMLFTNQLVIIYKVLPSDTK